MHVYSANLYNIIYRIRLIPIIILHVICHAQFISALDWELETVDDAGNVGSFCCLTLNSAGFPHLSYHDATNEYLKYAYYDGPVWHAEVIDTSTYRTGWYTSIAVDAAGNPHISYFAAVDLKYAYRDDVGWHLETIQTGAYLGGYTSVALDQNGFPHIAYYWQTSHWGGNLRYAFKDAEGWHVESVDNGNNRGKWASLKLDDANHAHIGYCDYCLNSWYDHPEDLRYAFRGAEGWNLEIADGTGCVGGYSSMDLDSQGYPHMSHQEQVYFYDPYPKRLRYTYKDGEGWHTQILDDNPGAGTYTSLAVNQYDKPRIAYWETHNRGLTYASMLDSIWYLEKIDPPEIGGGDFPALVLDINGFPRIGYRKGSTSLGYIRSDGISLASCAEENSLVLYWSPYPMGSSYCCYGEENNTYFEPRGENVIADIPQNVFSLSCAFGAGDPNAEWVFIILTVDELGAELSRSNYAGERDFPWIFP